MEALGVATAGGLLDVSEEALVTLRAGLSAEQVGRASWLSGPRPLARFCPFLPVSAAPGTFCPPPPPPQIRAPSSWPASRAA
eukprot:COSAG01_NODE_1144_length_11530_cov_4.888549_5_plen_82_part_00